MEGKYRPRRLNEVFEDFKGRRTGIIKALSTDIKEFLQKCDPESGTLSLYGHPDETWEVNIPPDEVPADLPEPASGINFGRDLLQRRVWLSLVAMYSDVWLLSVAFYYGARMRYGKRKRRKLFRMINNLPTILEVVIGADSQVNKSSVQNNNEMINISGEVRPRHPDSYPKEVKNSTPKDKDEDENEAEDEKEEEEDDEQEATPCGACSETYTEGEFWICCDICEKWFHGDCVKITPERAEHIKLYECPICSSKKSRLSTLSSED